MLPRLDGKSVDAHIDALSREPFREMLKRLLEAEPSVEAVRKYAERCPDRWGQLVTMVAKLSGYHERLEVDHSHAVAVSQMNDSELLAEYARLQAELTEQGEADVVALPVAKQDATPSANAQNGEHEDQDT